MKLFIKGNFTRKTKNLLEIFASSKQCLDHTILYMIFSISDDSQYYQIKKKYFIIRNKKKYFVIRNHHNTFVTLGTEITDYQTLR